MNDLNILFVRTKPGLARRCRAGLCFGETPRGIERSMLDDAQLAALENDPCLIIDPAGLDLEAAGLSPLESASPEPERDAHAELSQEEQREGLILAVMGGMLAADPERADDAKWTKAQAPDVGYLNQQLRDVDVIVSAAERNRLWAKLRG